MTRTYSRDDFLRAKGAWTAFSGPRWAQVRQAASSWTIFPPSETGQDWRDAPHPSQRVIVWFAVENRPGETLEMIRRSSSWSGVIDRIFAAESRIRTDITWDEESAELERRYERANYRGSMRSIGDILTQWKDSAP